MGPNDDRRSGPEYTHRLPEAPLRATTGRGWTILSFDSDPGLSAGLQRYVWSDDTLDAQRLDGRAVVAEFSKDLAGVLAEERWRGPDAGRRGGKIEWTANLVH